MDLFETPELLPKEVQEVLEKYSEMDNTYENCNTLIDELNKVGYTCEYYLDGIPTNLKKLEDEEFEFYLDQKHTIWYRNKFTISAKNLEEAKAKVIELCNTNTQDLPSDEWDLIHETVEELSVCDNGGQATEELYTHDGNMIWQNI
jgi:hypothetical protein